MGKIRENDSGDKGAKHYNRSSQYQHHLLDASDNTNRLGNSNSSL